MKSFDLKPRSKGSPLAAGGDFIRFVLFIALGLVWWFAPWEAHADNVAEKVFGGWVRVTPETILQEVPDWHFQKTNLGAVTNEYRKKDRPASPGGPNSSPLGDSPRSTAPEQVVGHQTNLPERR